MISRLDDLVAKIAMRHLPALEPQTGFTLRHRQETVLPGSSSSGSHAHDRNRELDLLMTITSASCVQRGRSCPSRRDTCR